MNKKKIPYLILILVLILGFVGVFSKRIDLTSEKRYTLSEASVSVLKSIKKPMIIEVYLEGDFPASFKQLQKETQFMLEEFRSINPKIDYKFIDPIKTKMSQDTLMAMGMQPSILPDMKDGKISEIVLFPYTVIKYGENGVSIPLIVQQNGIDASEQITKSLEVLEYNLISNIKSIAQEEKKNVGILINQDELRPDEFHGFMQMALENYNAGPVIPEQGEELSFADLPKMKKMQALVIAKPRKAFTDQEKLVLDQYIMNGGRTLWMIDAVNAEMDTLFRSEKIMAYPIDNNLTDFFFHFGIRINSGLVKDQKKHAYIRLNTGQVQGNQQYSNFGWPYFSLGIADKIHPITKNINPIKFEFPTAIDTLSRPGIKKKVLYESSERTLLKPVPSFVSLNEIIRDDKAANFEKPSTPKIFAVALEGKFQSSYANRVERSAIPNFRANSPENRMIVISDGDIARNAIIKGKPLPLGVDILTQQQYGNEQFLRNALDYLLDDANLMELRNRNIEARLLDRARILEEKQKWQWLNLLIPILILSLMGWIFYYLRKRKFAY